MLLANEFLDALPIRQFVRRGGLWMERFVEEGRFVESRACAAPLPQPPPARGGGAVIRISPPLAGGGWGRGRSPTILERNEPAIAIAEFLGPRLAIRPGAALFLDYGPEHSTPGDSLQALRDGRPADPLTDPGTADLTAHVDFAAFAAAARAAGAATHGPVAQGLFLTRLGLFQRTDRLARTQPPAQALALIEAARRLAEPNRMGRLFKALALCSPGLPTPPGSRRDALDNIPARRQKPAMPLTADSLRVPHGFFTRQGGVSGGPYASLNCSLSGGDERDAVLENRARAARAIGAEPDRLVGLMQVHGADVVEVTAPWPPGNGPRADAMVTDRPDIALGIITADCAPVLLADTEAGVVGAAHAGWRGAVAGVIEATVAAMVGLGADPPRSPRRSARASARILRGGRRPARRGPGAGSRTAPLLRRRATGGSLAVRPCGLLRRPARRRRRPLGQVLDADTAADEARFFSHRGARWPAAGRSGTRSP